MASNRIVVAICCYGLFDPDVRSEKEMEGLEEYLGHSAKYIAGLYWSGRLAGVILCGGYTNRTKPDVSEAETNAKYLWETLEREYEVPPVKLRMCFEDESFNTPQNLWFTAQLLRGSRDKVDVLYTRYRKRNLNPPTGELHWAMIQRTHLGHMRQGDPSIVFICDRYRHFKVWALLQILKFGRLGQRFRVISFPRRDIHPNSSWLKQIGAGLLYLVSSVRLNRELEQGQ